MKLTFEQIARIEKLVNLGYTDKQIASEFGNVTDGSIYYWRKKLGIKTSFTYEKISKVNHNKLIELFNEGLSDYKIAKILGIKPCSVFNYRKYHKISRKENFKYGKRREMTDFQKQMLIGILMGDGSMRNPNTNPSFCCMHGIKQKDYCEYKNNLLTSLGSKISYHKRNKIDERTGKYYEDYSIYLPANPALSFLYNSFYPEKKKILPISILNEYTEVSLAFHYMDDGSKNKNGYTLATQSFDSKSLLIFIRFLKERFGIESSLHKNNTVYIKKISCNLFKSLVEPYFCESMKYKL